MKKMKPIKLGFGIMLFLSVILSPLVTSCSDDDATTDTTSSVTEEKAARVMKSSVSSSDGGLSLQTDIAITITITTNRSSYCGIERDSTISKNRENDNHSYSYTLSWTSLLTCNDNTPSQYDFSFDGTGTYSNSSISSDDKISGAFVVSGLNTNELVLDQTYSQNGSKTTDDGDHFTSQVDIETKGVTYDVITRKIKSGSGTISISGKDSNGTDYSYTGILTFEGNDKATIQISGGGTYNIVL